MKTKSVTEVGPFCRKGLPLQGDPNEVAQKSNRCQTHSHAHQWLPAAKSCPAGRTYRKMGLCLIAFLLFGCELTPEPNAVNESVAEQKKTAETRKSEQPSTGSSPSAAILDDIELSLVRIRSGLFQMGSSDPEQYGEFSRCEGPRHSVQITRDFLISRHEVTVGQFRTFIDAVQYITDAERSGEGCNCLDVTTGGVIRRPECVWLSPGFAQTDQHPVVCVSWADAVAFCEWLSRKSGQVCRLPTEAEWEYCCRAGTETIFETGDDFESLKPSANCGDQSLHGACSFLTATANWDDGFPFTAPVGTFKANRFGLHDMHGNVGEWCLDWFDADYYAGTPETDPRGPETAQQWHVVRGGSWYNNPVSCRASGRHDEIPTEASTTNGFRIVVEIPDSQ